ncbi:MAG: hypothetical protein SOT14_02865 [Succinivibrio sp.]|nr:hypothetical protein [Succinivibrio sp.]
MQKSAYVQCFERAGEKFGWNVLLRGEEACEAVFGCGIVRLSVPDGERGLLSLSLGKVPSGELERSHEVLRRAQQNAGLLKSGKSAVVISKGAFRLERFLDESEKNDDAFQSALEDFLADCDYLVKGGGAAAPSGSDALSNLQYLI